MKYYIYLIFSFISFGQVAFAQETIKTSTKSIDVIRLFSEGNNIEWAVPISENEKILLQWEERNTSFTEKEGIRTFVGYNNDEFVATLSISKDQKILGNFEWKQTQWDIKTSDDGYIILFSEEKGEKCGLCSGGNCHVHHPKTPQQTPFSRPATEKNTYHIHSDEILRVYRLAVLVDWYYYSREGSIEAVKKYWSSLEATLNEIYMRDIGIKFEIVNDEKLIFNTSDKQTFDNKTSRYIIDNSTLKINQLIGADNYDVGIVIAKSRSKNNGLAVLGGAFDASKKAAAVAIKSYATIGHELGHMFGSLHTFTTGGDSTIKTEPENGTSIMSYGSPRDFFSLPSIYFIRRRILGDGAYYQDRARTILKKEWLKGENPVFGIDTKNQAPIIDVSKLESEYRLPKETFFQFTINATDPDNDPLLYAIHQADIKNDETSSVAEFVTEKSSSVNTKAYYTHWVTENGFLRKQYDLKVGKEYTFWLGVNDTKNTLNERSNHATRYDMHEAKVKFVEGKPFKITKFEGKKYKMGEKVTLTWDVDQTLFQNTKVRILLSDDFGKTFKHILVPETENDGSCEIVMPNIAIGRKVYYTDQNGRPIFHSGLGLIKVEVLDHIAFALTDNDITTGEGGFEIEKSAITLNNLPEKYVIVNQESEIPLKANITATSTCGSNPVTIVNKEEKNGNITTRTWTATDDCNNQTSFVQYIEVKPLPESLKPLQFVGTLPKDFVTYCHNAYTENEAPQLQVIGGKSPKVYLTENKQLFGDQKGFQIKRVWVAVDEVAKTISHTQYIVVRDIENPKLSAYPQDMVVKSRSEVPQRAELTATDCGNKIEVKSSTDNRTNGQGKEVVIYSWLATDSYGNEEYHEQTITIDPDATPPSPIDLKFITTPPASISATCNAVLSADYSQFATDGCPSVNITHTDTKINGSCANTYTIRRLYTATGCDQSVSFEQIISVTDDKAPTFNESLPIDISVEENNIPIQIDLTATDNCSENIQVTKSQEEKQENGNKVIIYKWEASDDCGNKATYTQKVTIIPLEIQFIGELPKNMTVTCEKEIPSVPTLEVSGNCSPKVVYKGETKSNEKCKNDYVLTRSWTATNDCGKSITHTQVITIKDDVKPVFSGNLPTDISVEEKKVPTQVDLTATDNCSENIQVVKIQEERQENGNKVIIYKWEASDDCGNKVTYAQKVTVVPSEINFVGELPKNLTISCEKEIPSVPTLQVSGNCNTKVVYNGETKSNEKCKNNYVLTRSWTATNDCRKSITHTQVITIKDDVKPVFSGTLPADISVEENKIPEQMDLTATDNCSEKVQVIKSKEEKQEGENKVITYKWEASDECGNKVTHEQKVTVKKSLQPTPPNGGSEVEKEMIVYNGVSTESGSENYLKFEPIEDYKNLQIEIFNELGQKVYESKNYQKNGEVFRGYANVKGVFKKSKRLPTGTYFYVLKYQDITGKSNTKQGYLFVR